MNKNFIFIIIFLLFVFYFLSYSNKEKFVNKRNHHMHHEPKKLEKNICRGFLTDLEYLDHMIPHHQVAIDISIKLQSITKSPVMHEILRKLIFNQKMEIYLMNFMKNKLPKNVSSCEPKSKRYIPTIGDYIKPNNLGLTKTYCDPHFFDPKGHMKHLEHMILNDKTYIEHMIPHHQVAVDMSKVLIKNTKNDFMIYLAYRIIRSQQAEVIILTDLLNKSKIYFESKLL